MKSTDSGSDYYLKYSLERDPFPLAIDDALYQTPEFLLHLQGIRESIAGSQKTILIIAAPGAGKSTLADYLETRPEDNWRIHLIQAEDDMNREALSHRLVQMALPEKAGKPSMAVPLLHKYLELSSHAGFVPVFIIDDADKLPVDTLQLVLELASLRYAESLYRFVLFADESMAGRLEHPALGDLAADKIHLVQLSRLSNQQTREYIETRLAIAGKGTYRFDDRKIEHIYSVSDGLPGKINLAARAAMLAGLETPSKSAHKETVSPGVSTASEGPATAETNNRLAAGASIAAAIILGAWLYLSTNEPVVQPSPTVAAVATDIQPAEQTVVEPGPATTEPAVNSDMDIPAAGMSSIVATEENTDAPSATPVIPEDVVSETSATVGSTASIAEPATSVPETAAAQQDTLPTGTVNPETAIAGTAGTAVAVPPEPATDHSPAAGHTIDEANIYSLDPLPPALAGIRGNGWYRQQSRSAYTLQLISASEINNVIELLEDAPDVRADISGYVKYTPSGKPRYLMFYGLYPDKDAASSAISGLPASIQAVNPWPRSIGNITDEIDTVIAP